MRADQLFDGQLHLRHRHAFAERLLGVATGELAEQLGVRRFLQGFLACHPTQRSFVALGGKPLAQTRKIAAGLPRAFSKISIRAFTSARSD